MSIGVSHYSRVLGDPGDLINVDQVSTELHELSFISINMYVHSV
jgi:hypothetical protein